MGSSVASVLVWGGGGGGEALRSLAPQNTSAYIQSMQFPFITYGMALYTTV